MNSGELEARDTPELMPFETPVLKVSRPVAACTRCRMAKIKCDGALPACTSCERSGRAAECTGTNDQFAKGKERSYVSTLETRIEKLLEKLEEARRRKPSVISIPDDETAIVTRRPSLADDAATPLPPAVNGASRAERRQENHAIDDLVSDFGFLSVHATARDFFGFTQAMTYSRLIVWASSRDPLPEGITKALPARHVAVNLLQHYLGSLHQLVPFIDEASLYSCVNNVYIHERAEPFDHFMVRMVLAVANASISERSGDQNYLDGIAHVCAALEHAEVVLHPGAMSSVQALVLLTIYALLDPHHFDAWTLIGAASRAMADLGLHQDPLKGTTMSKGKLETRRRIFWAVYVLDRSTSLVQSRAFSFSDDSTKVKSAFSKQPGSSAATSPLENSDKARSWLQSNEQALDLISLRQLQSVWYTDLFQSGRDIWNEPYPYIWRTCDSLSKWFEKLSPSTPTYMRSYFELELLYSYIYILAPSPRVQTIVPYAQTLIFEYCIKYADRLLHLLNTPEQKLAPITFTDAMRAYMIGRFFLDILQQNTDGLLSGVIPPLPGVPPSAAPPPAIPEVKYPPETEPQYFNIIRAIECIRRLTEALSRFGLRWGYLSWSQHYAAATAPMIEQLTQRQRDYEALSSIRRGSVWTPGSQDAMTSGRRESVWTPGSHVSHHSSVSSLGNLSVGGGRSPHQSISPPQQQQQYFPTMAPAVQSLSSYGTTSPPSLSPPAQISPPIGHQPQLWQHSGVVGGGLYQTHSNQSSGGAVQQPDPSGFSFADSGAGYTQTTAFSTAPHLQFQGWGGYAGPHVVNTLDEENAAAPPINMPWDQAKQ